MKVRLFEEYNNEYYQELTRDEFDSIIFDESHNLNVSSFTESEINKIKDHVVNRYKKLPEYDFRTLLLSKEEGYIFKTQTFNSDECKNYITTDDVIIRLRFRINVEWGPENGPGYVNITIYKLDDEWYVVSISRWPSRTDHQIREKLYGEFKCDQLEGLFKFLDDYHPKWDYKYSK